MRLFTGIDLPDEVREKLERLLMHLRPCAHLKWSPVYNLHVTLKFIGEWPEQKLPQLEAALRSVAPRSPIAAEVKGLVEDGVPVAALPPEPPKKNDVN